MSSQFRSGISRRGLAVSAALLLGANLVNAGDGVDASLSGWLGREITIERSSLDNQIPVGGKLTFVYDTASNVVRMCTRQADSQGKPWSGELAASCNVTLTFTKGERYCTIEDVKAGDGEVLSTCHRLRSRELALNAPTPKGVELHDLLVFLIEEENNKHAISILVDSPSRVTTDVIIIGRE